MFTDKAVCVFVVGGYGVVDVLAVVIVFVVSSAIIGGVEGDMTFDTSVLDCVASGVGVTEDGINVNVAGDNMVEVVKVELTIKFIWSFVLLDELDRVDGIVSFVISALDCVDAIVGVNEDGIDIRVENDGAVVAVIVGLNVNVIWGFVVGLLGAVDALVVDVASVVCKVINGVVVMEVVVSSVVLRTEAHVCGTGVVAPASYSVVVIVV